MELFTGYQYLLIDVANQFNIGKVNFQESINWTIQNMDNLENLIESADIDTRPQFVKAVMAVREAQQGVASGHMVGFDACSSGLQIMSAITGCHVGAASTGLVDPNNKVDAYNIAAMHMNDLLEDHGLEVNVPRKDVKAALMTSFYGSKEKPKEIFGEDTIELDAFYAAAELTAPGAWKLLKVLLGSWQVGALSHQWVLPDGFESIVKVQQRKEKRIEVDELNHATFTYVYYVNEGSEYGLSNPANVVQSIDAYIVRSMHRRCNYAPSMINHCYTLLEYRNLLDVSWTGPIEPKIQYYKDLYAKTGIADIAIFPYVNLQNVLQLSNDHVSKLEVICKEMLTYKPFPVVTIHDEFKCHPNNMNYLRQQYINILVDLADSNLLQSILADIYDDPTCSYAKESINLSSVIKGSNYALG